MSVSKGKNSPSRFTRTMNKKLIVFFLAVVLLLLFLGARIFAINYTNGDVYTKQVLDQQQYSSTTLPYKRGDIVDRNGVVLATSIKMYNLVLDPKIILSDDGKYYEATVTALSQVFGFDEQDIRNIINTKAESRYVVYKKSMDYTEIKPFIDIQNDTKNYPYVKGVWFEEEYIRKYPYSTLASGVLGFTLSGNIGNWGIEGRYSSLLNGTDGRKYGYVDENNNMESVIKDPVDGNTVVSTIDFNIQTIVEKYIEQWKNEYTPQNIGVIVADPNTNEILAMASDVKYDLNNPRDLSAYYTEEELAAMTDEETVAALNKMWRNYCISDTYEPGSTFKPFTVVTALEESVVEKNHEVYCDGKEVVGGWTIKCHENAGHGKITLEEAIAYSCNDAMMELVDKMGANLFTKYQSRFNFGKYTGIDLPGEESCGNLVYSAENMGSSTLATNSFGQNFNVTMIQMVSAFSSVINGGYYYQPHVVKEILNPSGGVSQNIGTTLVKRTATEENSEFIREACYLCVSKGSGRSARIEGYKIGGKTGTAQKQPRDEEKYVVSFMGFVSDKNDNPQVICYVVVDDPVVEKISSSVASKLWKAIMEEVLPYMNIFPETADDNTDDNTNTGSDNTGNSTDNTNTDSDNTGNSTDNTNTGTDNTGNSTDDTNTGNTDDGGEYYDEPPLQDELGDDDDTRDDT